MEKFAFGKTQEEAPKTQEKIEKKSVIVSLEELIPGIKPSSEINIGDNDIDGRKLDDEYSHDLFSRDFAQLFFDGYCLRKENLEKLEKISGALESCTSEDEWLEAQKDSSLDFDALGAMEQEDVIGFAFSKFKDQIVVDLGCGYHARAYDFISLAGARGYVGVDMFHGNSFANDDSFSTTNKTKTINKIAEGKNINDAEAIPASFSADDMLTFLKRLPDNSVSIFASGIDGNVLNLNSHYINKISQEIQRVLSEKGAFISYQSCFHPTKLNSELAKIGSPLYGLSLYKKPKARDDEKQ